MKPQNVPITTAYTDHRKTDYKCTPDSSFVDDMPPNWATNQTHMCGVSWPQKTPLQNISLCCTEDKPVEVSNACFHYCETDLDSTKFSFCVEDKFSPEHFIVSCNSGVGFQRSDRTWSSSMERIAGVWAIVAIGALFALVVSKRRRGRSLAI